MVRRQALTRGSKDIFVVPALGLFHHQMNELNNPQNKDKQTLK